MKKLEVLLNKTDNQEESVSIKLSKFEHDLLSVCEKCTSGYKFEYHPPLTLMQEKGYFKGVDPEMKIKEILKNVVIE